MTRLHLGHRCQIIIFFVLGSKFAEIFEQEHESALSEAPLIRHQCYPRLASAVSQTLLMQLQKFFKNYWCPRHR
jgi:hypothetical protein